MSHIHTVPPALKNGMEHACSSEIAWNDSVTDVNMVNDSARLHYMLTQAHRWTSCLNAGDGKGLEAWRRLARILTHARRRGRQDHHGERALPLHL